MARFFASVIEQRGAKDKRTTLVVDAMDQEQAKQRAIAEVYPASADWGSRRNHLSAQAVKL